MCLSTYRQSKLACGRVIISVVFVKFVLVYCRVNYARGNTFSNTREVLGYGILFSTQLSCVLKSAHMTNITQQCTPHQDALTAVEFRFFEPPDNSNQESFPSPQLNTVILPPIYETFRFFEPIFVSVGGSINRDSTKLVLRRLGLVD